VHRYLFAAAALFLLFAALPAVTAAPQTTYPGQMTEARVWVQNHTRADAVSVDLRDVSFERPLKVHVANGEPGAGDTLTVVARAARQGWDYDTVTVARDGNAADGLNARGAAGWEAVGVVATTANGTSILLKRPR
jgi:hypothetical protein